MIDLIREKLFSMLDSGRYEWGLADMRGLVQDGYAGYSTGISLALRLDSAIVDGIVAGPTRKYFDHYNEVNNELAVSAEKVAQSLADLGLEALAVRPTLHDHEIDASMRASLRVGLSHKMVATRAGLGWIGKTDLLVTKKFGPRVRLASVLVREALEGAAVPITESRCGACTVCVDACPGRTANGTLWKAGIDRDSFFNASACRETCRRLSREKINEEISLCGICVALCPFGK